MQYTKRAFNNIPGVCLKYCKKVEGTATIFMVPAWVDSLWAISNTPDLQKEWRNTVKLSWGDARQHYNKEVNPTSLFTVFADRFTSGLNGAHMREVIAATYTVIAVTEKPTAQLVQDTITQFINYVLDRKDDE